MKSIFPILLFLSLIPAIHASGPWIEYSEQAPEPGSPAQVVTNYVQLANTGNLEACRRYMVPEYEAWLERVGGIEACLEVFTSADLNKRFAWRQAVEGESAKVWIRVYVTPRGREVNVALNLRNTTDGWRLVVQ